MAQNIKPGAAKKDEAPAQNKDKKTIILIGIIVLMALIIAAGGGWFFAIQKGGSPHAEEVKVAPPKNPLFIILEPFTVNLQREDNDQYLQIGITLKVFEGEAEAKIKTNLPEIRSKILQLLTTKTATELLTAEGKQKLVNEIITLGNSVIGISNASVPSAIANKPGIMVTASQVAASTPAASHAQAAEVLHQANQKGIVDVLFTSFIIQ